MNYKNIIAIDPDVSKSGIAFLEVETRKLELSNLTFFQIFDYLKACKNLIKSKDDLIVLIEAGWLNRKSNFHNTDGLSGEYISKQVGLNHEVGIKLIEMCEYLKIPSEPIKPLLKCWLGKNKKITHEEFQQITGIIGSTNQDERDAGLIAWYYAELPMILK